MTLEPINIVCPHCGNGSYMRRLVGKGVGRLDIKCINCNSYFNSDELFNRLKYEAIQKKSVAMPHNIFKPMTNADRIRAKTDEELAEWECDRSCSLCPIEGCEGRMEEGRKKCKQHWLDWLKQEIDE